MLFKEVTVSIFSLLLGTLTEKMSYGPRVETVPRRVTRRVSAAPLSFGRLVIIAIPPGSIFRTNLLRLTSFAEG